MFNRSTQAFVCIVVNFLLVVQPVVMSGAPAAGDCNTNASAGHGSHGVTVASLHIETLVTHVTIIILMLVVILIKTAYSHMHIVQEYIPESVILIGCGVLFGLTLKYAHLDEGKKKWSLTAPLFFQFLLPPIILEAAYTIYNRVFADNLGIILVFAVIGTILNFITIGFSIYGLAIAGAMGLPYVESLTIKSCLLFSSLIVAVDPVAVLAIFEDLGVNEALYYMVFGESLLNDAVTIVLYGIMESFMAEDNITGRMIGTGIAKFFTVSLGGFAVGIVTGIFSALVTRFTYRARSMESLVVLLLAYFSYILGDLFGWSGIISMIGCGTVQAAYSFHNVSEKSVITIHKVAKFAAHISESIIFVYLGVEIVTQPLIWHTGFHLWGLSLCILARTVIVMGLSSIINYANVDNFKISFKEQAIIIYGGLRGAVAFCLAVLISKDNLVGGQTELNLYITCTLWIILFTSIAMGISMKPLAKLFSIKLATESKLSLMYELNLSAIDHVLAGIEGITGDKGRNYVRDMIQYVDDHYIRRVLQRDPLTHDQKLMQTYQKVSLALHYATVRPEKSEHYLDKIAFRPLAFQTSSSSKSLGSLENTQPTIHLPVLPAEIVANESMEDLEAGITTRRKSIIPPEDSMPNDEQLRVVFRQSRAQSISEEMNPSRFSSQLQARLQANMTKRQKFVSNLNKLRHRKRHHHHHSNGDMSNEGGVVNQSYLSAENVSAHGKMSGHSKMAIPAIVLNNSGNSLSPIQEGGDVTFFIEGSNRRNQSTDKNSTTKL